MYACSFVKLLRLGDIEVTFSVFKSSCQSRCLAQGHNKRTCGLSSHYPFNDECHGGKVRIPTFKFLWSYSIRKLNPSLPTTKRTH